jgi:pimeloyl-ACP methyl ester carboxylesterase
MQLAFRRFEGTGSPLIILHGLFGSSKNWATHARELSALYDVYTVDHRNHGDSPWSDEHTLKAMVADMVTFHNEHIRQPAIYLGHSMGGLVAMGMALLHSDSVKALIVADIAPRSYEPHHQREFAALRIDVSQMTTRQDVDRAMAVVHPEPGLRQFLQMNLERRGNGFRWKINVDALEKAAYLAEFDNVFTTSDKTYSGPALFLAGRASNYIREQDHARIKELFPHAEIRVIDGDHWLHHSNYAGFMREVKDFLKGIG